MSDIGKDEASEITSAADFLNSIPWERCGFTQQALYLVWKEIKKIQDRLTNLETVARINMELIK